DIFLAQEYIKEAHGQDLRIFVTRKGDSFSMLRKSSTGDFRSNIHLGGTPSPTQTSTEEIELAFKALEIFELDYAGIDILRSHQGPLILEVNPCPGFEALETINGPVVAEAIVELTTTVT